MRTDPVQCRRSGQDPHQDVGDDDRLPQAQRQQAKHRGGEEQQGDLVVG